MPPANLLRPPRVIVDDPGKGQTMNRLPFGQEVCEEPTIVATASGAAGDEVFQRALEAERRLNARRVGWLSLTVVSAFLVLFVLLGVVLGVPYWASVPRLLTVYWLIVVVFFWAGTRWEWIGRHAALTIPLL